MRLVVLPVAVGDFGGDNLDSVVVLRRSDLVTLANQQHFGCGYSVFYFW
jgi:hypothetical protein